MAHEHVVDGSSGQTKGVAIRAHARALMLSSTATCQEASWLKTGHAHNISVHFSQFLSSDFSYNSLWGEKVMFWMPSFRSVAIWVRKNKNKNKVLFSLGSPVLIWSYCLSRIVCSPNEVQTSVRLWNSGAKLLPPREKTVNRWRPITALVSRVDSLSQWKYLKTTDWKPWWILTFLWWSDYSSYNTSLGYKKC